MDQDQDALARMHLGQQQGPAQGDQGLAAAGHAVDQAHRKVARRLRLLLRQLLQQLEVELGGPFLLRIEEQAAQAGAVAAPEAPARHRRQRQGRLGKACARRWPRRGHSARV
jgi:hypothetical protein